MNTQRSINKKSINKETGTSKHWPDKTICNHNEEVENMKPKKRTYTYACKIQQK